MIRRPDSPRVRRSTRAAALVLVGGLFAAGAISGCTPDATPPASQTPTASASDSPAATPTPTPAPTLDPEGTAADNLPLFTAVTAAVWASGDLTGRAYVDALAAAGFDKAAMQVTADTTTVGNPAESIQFSVAWGDRCLIGQVGPATGDPVTIVAPALTGGGCLIGETRPITW